MREDFIIKYEELQELLIYYQREINSLVEVIRKYEDDITKIAGWDSLQGEAGRSIAAYLKDVHGVHLNSIKTIVTTFINTLLLYKAQYYNFVDNSTEFVLEMPAIENVQLVLGEYVDSVAECSSEIGEALSSVSEIISLNNPSYTAIETVHGEIDTKIIKLKEGIEEAESAGMSILNDLVSPFIEQIMFILTGTISNPLEISEYKADSYLKDANVSQMIINTEIFSKNLEDNAELYEQFRNQEKQLQEMAEARKTQGVWMTIGGIGLIVTGTLCLYFTAGASSQLIVYGGGILGGGTIAFGTLDAIEGGQEIYYGSNGNQDTESVNIIKSAMGEQAYTFTESAFAFGSSAMMPIAGAYANSALTFRSGCVIVGEEVVSELAGYTAQTISTEMGANEYVSMGIGILASYATGKGLTKFDAKYNVSGFNALESGTPTQGYSNFADGMSPEDAARYIANNEKAFFNEFSDRASAAGLSDTQIAEAFEAMRDGEHAKMATYFDTSSPVDGAVFWSGNKEGAAAYANSIGGTIMEQTPGGQVFDNWRGLGGMYPEWDTSTNLAQKPIWDALSSQYANGAEGIATYAHPNGYVGRVWSNIEKPILEANDIIIQEVIIDAK